MNHDHSFFGLLKSLLFRNLGLKLLALVLALLVYYSIRAEVWRGQSPMKGSSDAGIQSQQQRR